MYMVIGPAIYESNKKKCRSKRTNVMLHIKIGVYDHINSIYNSNRYIELRQQSDQAKLVKQHIWKTPVKNKSVSTIYKRTTLL